MNVGDTTKTGWKLVKRIDSLDEFWDVINMLDSIYARHRMYPTAFFHNWPIRMIHQWIERGFFFIARK